MNGSTQCSHIGWAATPTIAGSASSAISRSRSPRTLQARIRALENRVSDLEDSAFDGHRRASRRLTRIELYLERLLSHFGIEDVTENEVDIAINDEATG